MVVVIGCALALGACGGDDQSTRGTITSVATEIPSGPLDVPVPVDLRPRDRPAFIAGREVARDAGCLACHRIGSSGGDLGSSLNGVGDRLSKSALRRALVNPDAPMPSYRALPGTRLDELVVFLAALGVTPAGPPCPDDSDCG